MSSGRTVVVSHLVPVFLERKQDGKWTARWDEEINKLETSISRYTALGVRRQPSDFLFIGSPQVFVPRSERAAAEAAIEAAGIQCVLVHLEPKVAGRFYQGFCKSTLWPLLHNVLDVYNTSTMGAIIDHEVGRPSLDKRPSSSSGSGLATESGTHNKPWQSPRTWNPIEGQEETWSDYCEVNRAIAKAVIENYQDDDLIWVQHYHLLLLPSYLARKLRRASIGTRLLSSYARRLAPPPLPRTWALPASSRTGRLGWSMAPTLFGPHAPTLRVELAVSRAQACSRAPVTGPRCMPCACLDRPCAIPHAAGRAHTTCSCELLWLAPRIPWAVDSFQLASSCNHLANHS